jgi:hypothetical protein
LSEEMLANRPTDKNARRQNRIKRRERICQPPVRWSNA